MADLNREEVKALLGSYPEEQSGVTDELYSFGELLLKDAVERFSHIDGKAFALAGYAAGTISVLISTLALWRGVLDGLSVLLIVGGILGLMVAAYLAIHSARPSRIDWFSENDWLRCECLQERERLRRYRVLTMWQIIRSHRNACQSKSGQIELSQKTMAVSFALLAFALFDVAWRHAAFQGIWIWVRQIFAGICWLLFLVVAHSGRSIQFS